MFFISAHGIRSVNAKHLNGKPGCRHARTGIMTMFSSFGINLLATSPRNMTDVVLDACAYDDDKFDIELFAMFLPSITATIAASLSDDELNRLI